MIQPHQSRLDHWDRFSSLLLVMQAMLTQQLELVQLREAKALMQLDMDMMRAGLLVPATLPSARGVPDSTQADLTRVRLPGRLLMHSLSLQ